jgi:hypothetical protein
MRAYIKKLQSTPEIIRKQILLGSMIISMLVVSVIWINGIGYSFRKNKVAESQDVIKPFALLGQSLSETVDDIGASVGGVSSILKQKNNGNIIINNN